MVDPWHRERIVFKKLLELFPVKAPLLTPPVDPFKGKPQYSKIESFHLPHIPTHSVITIMSH
jgi:hypothetical protein